MEPVALALLTQRPPPLQLNFMSDPVQLLLAVMQPEVLVEALKHRPQVTLLVTSPPVHMLNQPLVGACEELAATLHAGKSDHGKPSAVIDPADVFEAQKFESLRPPTVPGSGGAGGKAWPERRAASIGGNSMACRSKY